jgi:hypothetical protein
MSLYYASLNKEQQRVDEFLHDFVTTNEQPNTALEPTADPRFGLPGSAGFTTRQFGGGSAFVR